MMAEGSGSEGGNKEEKSLIGTCWARRKGKLLRRGQRSKASRKVGTSGWRPSSVDHCKEESNIFDGKGKRKEVSTEAGPPEEKSISHGDMAEPKINKGKKQKWNKVDLRAMASDTSASEIHCRISIPKLDALR